jgi:hypothetical protein
MENTNTPTSVTLSEMIDKDLLDRDVHKGFHVGRGSLIYWHYAPTKNGYYRIWPQSEGGQLGMPRYVDADKTKITLINI